MFQSTKSVARFLVSLCAVARFQGHAVFGFPASDVITRDVCVIGGGSSGTYSAVRLRQLGKSVAVIEKEPVLGGHVNTYHDTATGTTFDYGVIQFADIPVVNNYFAHFNVSLGPATFPSQTTLFENFANHTVVSAASLPGGNLTAALLAYIEQLDKYPEIYNGYNLPSPIPEDFLIPWGSFLEKYDLGALAFTAFSYIQGVGNILAQPTLFILKYFAKFTAEGILNGGAGFLTTTHRNNHALYDAALVELGTDALVNSTVLSVSRSPSGVKVIISTPSGKKLIKASKLLIAIQPKLSNLPFLDLSPTDKDLFGQFNNSYYWDTVVRNSGVPDQTGILNIDPAAPFSLPPLPGLYGINPTTVSGLQTVYYSSPHYLSDEQVKQDIVDTLAKVVPAAGFPNGTANNTLEFVGFNNHAPFELTVSTDAVKAGFYDKLNKLQGQHSTWWTGATWQTHDSSLIWNWTEYNILPQLTK
jgi:hypothetical protein